MNQNVRDCLVTGYEQLIEELELPDANDRHVLAAAITVPTNRIRITNIATHEKAHIDKLVNNLKEM